MLVMGVMPLAVLFMLAFALAMMLNFPSLDEQRERLSAHAGNALAVGGLVFAAGIFTGILSGTQMVDAMAATVTHAVRSEEHTSELQSLMRISYAVFCLKKKNITHNNTTQQTTII